MNNQTIELDLNKAGDIAAFGQLIASLNKAGVPWSLSQDADRILIRVGTGF